MSYMYTCTRNYPEEDKAREYVLHLPRSRPFDLCVHTFIPKPEGRYVLPIGRDTACGNRCDVNVEALRAASIRLRLFRYARDAADSRRADKWVTLERGKDRERERERERDVSEVQKTKEVARA